MAWGDREDRGLPIARVNAAADLLYAYRSYIMLQSHDGLMWMEMMMGLSKYLGTQPNERDKGYCWLTKATYRGQAQVQLNK